MGEVWLVKDQQFSIPLAMKLIHKDCDIDTYHAFMAECQLLKSLDHPAIPKIVDAFATEMNYVVVMDYIEGGTLDTIGIVLESTLIDLAKQILAILKYLHSQNIWYCDLKPQNIIVKEKQLYIIDFGAAIKQSNHLDIRYGTIGYAAPEQLDGSIIDQRVDIYAFGKTLLSIYFQIQNPEYLNTINFKDTNLSLSLQRIIRKCVEEDPKQRYESIEQIQKDLMWLPLNLILTKVTTSRVLLYLGLLIFFFICCTRL